MADRRRSWCQGRRRGSGTAALVLARAALRPVSHWAQVFRACVHLHAGNLCSHTPSSWDSACAWPEKKGSFSLHAPPTELYGPHLRHLQRLPQVAALFQGAERIPKAPGHLAISIRWVLQRHTAACPGGRPGAQEQSRGVAGASTAEHG